MPTRRRRRTPWRRARRTADRALARGPRRLVGEQAGAVDRGGRVGQAVGRCAWNDPIGTPHALRSLTYSTPISSARAPIPDQRGRGEAEPVVDRGIERRDASGARRRGPPRRRRRSTSASGIDRGSRRACDAPASGTSTSRRRRARSRRRRPRRPAPAQPDRSVRRVKGDGDEAIAGEASPRAASGASPSTRASSRAATWASITGAGARKRPCCSATSARSSSDAPHPPAPRRRPWRRRRSPAAGPTTPCRSRAARRRGPVRAWRASGRATRTCRRAVVAQW